MLHAVRTANHSGSWGTIVLAAILTLIVLMVAVSLAPGYAWPLAGIAFVLLLCRFVWLVWHELK